jgi:AcrR family transcriptional regulator
MPKVADPAVRLALIEQAAQITADEGRDALTLRRLAKAVGVSTMAVYTHFGSMDELRREVRREGFHRLAVHMERVGRSGDPVADLFVLGWAYHVNATTNPNLYRAMFMEGPVDEEDAGVGLDTFQGLVDAVARCIEQGRIDSDDATETATQLWVTMHGVVALEIVGMLTFTSPLETLTAVARNLMLALGDSPSAVGASLARAQPRFADVAALP